MTLAVSILVACREFPPPCVCFAIALESCAVSLVDAISGLVVRSCLLRWDEGTFHACSALIFFVKHAERRMQVLAHFLSSSFFLKCRRAVDFWLTWRSLSSISFLPSFVFVIVLQGTFSASRARAFGCLQSSCLPSSFSSTGTTRIAMSLKRPFFLSYECFLLLIFQDVCDHCFQQHFTLFASKRSDFLSQKPPRKKGLDNKQPPYQTKGTEVDARTAAVYCEQGNIDITELIDDEKCKEHNAKGMSFLHMWSNSAGIFGRNSISGRETIFFKSARRNARRSESYTNVESNEQLGCCADIIDASMEFACKKVWHLHKNIHKVKGTYVLACEKFFQSPNRASQEKVVASRSDSEHGER